MKFKRVVQVTCITLYLSVINSSIAKESTGTVTREHPPSEEQLVAELKSESTTSEIKLKAYKKVFRVQVLLTISRQNAFKNRHHLKEAGYIGAFIKVVKAPDNTVYYKVFSGNYPSDKQAILEKRKIRKKFKKYKGSFVDRDE